MIHFDRFVRTVYRRMVLLRLIERIGFTIFIASLVALLAAGILLWHGRPGSQAG